VQSRRRIASRYLRGWFAFDAFLAGLDWVTVVHYVSTGEAHTESMMENAGAARAGRVARVMKAARLLRLMRLAKLRQLLFTLNGLIDSEWMTIFFAVVRNLLAIVTMNHYIACVWFAIGDESSDGWVTKRGLKHADYGLQYLVALHWSLAQFTPGASPVRPDTISERIFSVSVLIFAMVVATCFVSSITTTLAALWTMNRYASTQSFLLRKFLHQNRISRDLGGRVTRYVDCVLELRHKKVQTNKVHYLALLSGQLNVELQTEIWEPQLTKCPLLKRYGLACRSAMEKLCSSTLSLVDFSKHDVVFKHGALATHMYFVHMGSLAYGASRGHRRLAVFGSPEPERTRLEANDWCSEPALWVPWHHRGQMKALTIVEVIHMSVQKFRDVTSEDFDAYMLARGKAFVFWESFDPRITTDMPYECNHKGGSVLGKTAKELRDAEEFETQQLTRFD